MSDYRYLTLETERDIVRLTINRPEIRNAFDAELIAELTDCLSELVLRCDVRALVIAGAGKMFCAGADFHWMKSQKAAGYDANIEDACRLFDMFAGLYRFPRPTIARVQGGAFGGGAGLVACCDFVVMAQDAEIAFSEVRIGLIPATISPFVVRKIGESRARELFLTGRRISGTRAAEIGLANCAVPAENLDAAVGEYVNLIRQCGPEALSECKKLLEEVPGLTVDDARRLTARMIAERRASGEGQEGLSAFLEKRKPEWLK